MGSSYVCGPKPKNTSRTVKDSPDRVNRVYLCARNAANASDVRLEILDASKRVCEARRIEFETVG